MSAAPDELAPLPTTACLEFHHRGDRALGRRGLRPACPRVSVVVPAGGRAAHAREILPYLVGFFEVIVVVTGDDAETARAAREALPSARIVHQTRTGRGNALACGFAQANGDVIVTFDIDGSADPHEIPRLAQALADGADLAKGSRFCAGGGSQDITAIRALGHYALNLLASALTGTRLRDLCHGFNALWADQLPLLGLPGPAAAEPQFGDGLEVGAMIASRFALAKAVIIEVPCYEHNRSHGQGNLRAFCGGLRVLRTVLRDRRHGRRLRALASQLRSAGAGAGQPLWMVSRPRARTAPDEPDFLSEIQRTLDGAWPADDAMPEIVRMEMSIAAAEIGGNILDHAGRGRELRATMRVWAHADHVHVDFTDDGWPADVDLAAWRMPDALAENGRGLALARAMLRELSHRRDGDTNRWTLVSRRFG